MSNEWWPSGQIENEDSKTKFPNQWVMLRIFAELIYYIRLLMSSDDKE